MLNYWNLPASLKIGLDSTTEKVERIKLSQYYSTEVDSLIMPEFVQGSLITLLSSGRQKSSDEN